jgi:putative nucleotidyltransferase with HDIG domain
MHRLSPTVSGPQSARRLDAIARAGLTGVSPVDSLDRLTRVLATAVRAPVALATAVADDRQHFPGATGLDEPWSMSRQTPITHSFCRHVLGGRPLVVCDARSDPIVRHSPAIADLGIVAYAGMPLRVPGVGTLGALCAIDDRPRSWTGADLSLIRELADTAVATIRQRLEVAETADPAGISPSVRMLKRIMEAHDPGTMRHCERVAALALRIAAAMGWPAGRRVQLHEAALVHDIGKVGVPDAVLFKRGGLSTAELAVVRRHASLGARILTEALDREQVSWVRSHHERIDGLGYPDGLRGDAIPLGARILAVADSWDAMTAGRHYMAARPSRDALEECRRHQGLQFDPDVVDALESVMRLSS